MRRKCFSKNRKCFSNIAVFILLVWQRKLRGALLIKVVSNASCFPMITHFSMLLLTLDHRGNVGLRFTWGMINTKEQECWNLWFQRKPKNRPPRQHTKIDLSRNKFILEFVLNGIKPE